VTLLIETLARPANAEKSHLIITGDGRTRGRCGVLSDCCQKIFDMPGYPIALAHHGQNLLLGRPVNELLDKFKRQIAADIAQMSIADLAGKLSGFVDDPARETLRKIAGSKVIGFWAGGYGYGRAQPALLEILWEKDDQTKEIAFKQQDLGNIALGGQGQHLVPQYATVDRMYRWENIPRRDLAYALKYHEKVYELAKRAQAAGEGDLIGGHKHRLLVTRAGVKWLLPPKVE
jgi:hypothetical protein